MKTEEMTIDTNGSSQYSSQSQQTNTATDDMKIDSKVLYEYDLANRCPIECAKRIRTLCNELVHQRLDSNNKNKDENHAMPQGTIVASQTNHLMLQTFLDMRDTNRFYQFQAENSKLDVEKERQKFDNLNLLYQNYIYEKNHLLKEIHSLSEFNISEYQPRLVDEEYYRQKVNLTETEKEEGEDSEDSTHKQIVNRLNFELEERITMLKHLTDLQEKKKSQVQLNQTKQDFMSSLPKIVSDLSKKLLTVQPTLNSSYNQNIFHLPKPLYVIYSSVTSYQSSTKKSNLTLKIIGDIDKAIEFNINNNSSIDELKSTSSPTDSIASYTVHPLSLVIEFQCENQITPLQFQYVVDLNLVALVTSDSQDDCYLRNAVGSGLEIHPPIIINSSTVTTSTTSSINNNRGRFYDWVQILACLIGIGVDNTIDQQQQQQQHAGGNVNTTQWTMVSVILNNIEKRIQIKQKLKKQVLQLKKQLATKPPNDYRFVMSVFEELSSTTRSSLFSTTSVLAPHLNQTNYLSGYRIIFNNVNVEILVNTVISETITFFKISSKSLKQSSDSNPNNLLLEKETIKSIESELNLSALSLPNEVSLFDQIEKLKSILSYLGDPSLIRSKTLGRIRRGKLRTLPLHFDTSSQLWSHK